MADRVPICLFVCLALTCVYAQVGSLCRANERLLSCGCPKTCRDPVPNCEGVCKMGCFCEEGEVRNDMGHCVKLADCTPVISAIQLDTSEPRLHGGECPENEEYRFCEPCIRTCETPNPICPAQCSRGCFCKGNLLREKDGRCVSYYECANVLELIKEREREKNFIAPVPYRFTCGPNQVYKKCEKCTQTCNDASPVCGTKCKQGCFCKDGLVKGPDGKCTKIEDCPRAATLFSLPSGSSVEIEDCTSGEEYLSCGWCEPSCHEPRPQCPPGCTRGCLCRPPLLRHASGLCVKEDQCDTSRCSSDEEYVCRNICEHTCIGPRMYNEVLGMYVPCPIPQPSPRRCKLGCYCKMGLLRDKNRRCITFETCLNDTTTAVPPESLVETQTAINQNVQEEEDLTIFISRQIV